MGIEQTGGPSQANRKRIGYMCSYIPIEILAATGLQPYCLLHGDYELMQQGTAHARIDACPLVRANMAHIIQNAGLYAALVGATGCDMARRLFDIIAEKTDIPVFLIHVPRTDNYQIYSDEIDWLIQQLDRVSILSIHDEIVKQIEQWQHTREILRALDIKRADRPSRFTTTDFHRLACTYYKGIPAETYPASEKTTDRPRVYMVGSEISYESEGFLSLLESDLSIVGDNVCGLSQFLNVHINTKSISGIKQTYYQQTPCIYQRPNQRFYDDIMIQLESRSCDGVIGFTLDYCDGYEFELKKMEQTFGLPVLRIRGDYADEKTSQLRTRIAAFGELLCSRI
jgi:benzoyl-CoA reductase/2-hydroxyglutaryl-CoA dehydratase subunit BcrC/BadD/HgdB